MDAFGRAGCAHVNACLWPVDDLATGLLFTEFYRRLATGQSPTTSMQAAKGWLRDLPVDGVLERLRMFGLISEDQLRDPAALAWQLVDLGLPASANDPTARIYQHPYYWSSFILTI